MSILNVYHGYTFKVGRTNIDALATVDYQYAFMKCIGCVSSEPASIFSRPMPFCTEGAKRHY